MFLRDGTICRRCIPKPILPLNRCECCYEPCDDGRCFLCVVWPTNYSSSRYLYTYRGKTKSLLRTIKYKNRKRLLLSWLDKIEPLIKERLMGYQFDDITWIPTSTSHLFSRGFDVGNLIAHTISEYLRSSSPKKLLMRTREAPAQALLFSRQRLLNVKGLFTSQGLVCDRKILLVDDVMTTGASVAEATSALYKAGASRVDVFCLARSEHWSRYRRMLAYGPSPKPLDDICGSLIGSMDETSTRQYYL